MVLGEKIPKAYSGHTMVRLIASDHPLNELSHMTHVHNRKEQWRFIEQYDESYQVPDYLYTMGAPYLDYYWRVRHNFGVKQPRLVFFNEYGRRIHPYRIYFVNDQYFEAIFADEFGNPYHVDGRVEIYLYDEAYWNEHPCISPTSGSGGTGGHGGSGSTGGVGLSRGGSGGAGASYDYMLVSPEPEKASPLVTFILDYYPNGSK